MASDTVPEKLSLSVWLWSRLLGDLRRRGAGRRESGAFLLGRSDGPRGRITTYLCYDDLDPDSWFKPVSLAQRLWYHEPAGTIDARLHGSG